MRSIVTSISREKDIEAFFLFHKYIIWIYDVKDINLTR